MTARRTLGPGPERSALVGAAEADLHDAIPGTRFPNLDDLRARGLFSPGPAASPNHRRALGAGGRAADTAD
ncbi:hypothetical protein [Streptomyces sp. NPDC059604]|uniref:hypothetical protein n=1 Tax=Streptomyces sp. NPDC059604 TaxID=3346881 RepID=UPI0036885AC5